MSSKAGSVLGDTTAGRAAVVDVGWVVPVPGVPADDQGVQRVVCLRAEPDELLPSGPIRTAHEAHRNPGPRYRYAPAGCLPALADGKKIALPGEG